MYTIGRLAKRARVKADSIRFYERQGLVVPETKTSSGYRLYTDTAVRRITFIKHAQRCGFSLAEISELLQMHDANPAARKAGYRIAAEKKNEIEKTITALRAMSAALTSLLASAAETGGAEGNGSEDNALLTAFETCLSEQHIPRPAPATQRV